MDFVDSNMQKAPPKRGMAGGQVLSSNQLIPIHQKLHKVKVLDQQHLTAMWLQGQAPKRLHLAQEQSQPQKPGNLNHPMMIAASWQAELWLRGRSCANACIRLAAAKRSKLPNRLTMLPHHHAARLRREKRSCFSVVRLDHSPRNTSFR